MLELHKYPSNQNNSQHLFWHVRWDNCCFHYVIMDRGKRNDHIQNDPDIGVNFEGETLENTVKPMERVQDGLQGQNSTSNIGNNEKNGDQLHHVEV